MRRRQGGLGSEPQTSHSLSTTPTPATADWLSTQLERGSAWGSVSRGAAFAAALGAATAAAGVGGGLVYDDRALVIENQDLRPSTLWTALVFHDFWGTSLDDPRSHTSWRPVTVATLKLNFHAHELEPSGYHTVNLVLHASVCAMVVLVAKRCGIGGKLWQPSAVCGMLFAVHPAHGAIPALETHLYAHRLHVLSRTSCSFYTRANVMIWPQLRLWPTWPVGPSFCLPYSRSSRSCASPAPAFLLSTALVLRSGP